MLLALGTAQFQPVTPLTTAQTQQVYVHDSSAPAAAGDEPHDAGLRPVNANDSPLVQLFSARNAPLNVTLQSWGAATGSVTTSADGNGGTRVHATFANLVPLGHYSLFLRQLAGRTGAVLMPVDIAGAGANFVASPDGAGALDVDSPAAIPTGAQLVLIYHSDGQDHQSSMGVPGVNAHAQLITRVP